MSLPNSSYSYMFRNKQINTVEFIPLLLSTSSCAVHWSSADENWNNSDLTLNLAQFI